MVVTLRSIYENSIITFLGYILTLPYHVCQLLPRLLRLHVNTMKVAQSRLSSEINLPQKNSVTDITLSQTLLRSNDSEMEGVFTPLSISLHCTSRIFCL